MPQPDEDHISGCGANSGLGRFLKCCRGGHGQCPRAGIKQVLIPKDNEKNLVDIPKKVIDDIKITPVNTADEVLKIALTKELKPTDWVEVDKISENKKSEKTQASIQ